MIITIEKPTSNEVPRHLDAKERIESRELIAFKDSEFKSLITARWYMGKSNTASKVYCALWVKIPNADWGSDFANGVGDAGGYGYCKQSSAYSAALSKAGIKCSEGISGRGMSTVEDSMMALAKSLGYDHAYISRG